MSQDLMHVFHEKFSHKWLGKWELETAGPLWNGVIARQALGQKFGKHRTMLTNKIK